MKLEDYVYESWSPAPRHAFPGHLEIPNYLIEQFRELYRLTEERGQECAYILIYDDRSMPIRHGHVVFGTPTGINIPTSQSYYNFGDIHAHPSASIGHNGGYSAHSMQDLLVFRDLQDRTLFIKFVVSGPKLYAMVFRAGLSRFNSEVKTFAYFWKDEEPDQGRKYLIEKNFRSEKEYKEKIASFGPNVKVAEAYLHDLERQTPGFGKKMEEISVSACKQFAHRFGYGFYIGATLGPGTGRIVRQ